MQELSSLRAALLDRDRPQVQTAARAGALDCAGAAAALVAAQVICERWVN